MLAIRYGIPASHAELFEQVVERKVYHEALDGRGVASAATPSAAASDTAGHTGRLFCIPGTELPTVVPSLLRLHPSKTADGRHVFQSTARRGHFCGDQSSVEIAYRYSSMHLMMERHWTVPPRTCLLNARSCRSHSLYMALAGSCALNPRSGAMDRYAC